MKRFILVFLYFYILVFLLTSCTSQPVNNLKLIKIGEAELKVEIADTPELRYQGLSNRELLPENQGMLFVFENYSQPSFVMRQMNFPLDIIWIRDNEIIDIEKNIPAPINNQPLIHYSPSDLINYALEVNAGWTIKNEIEIGDRMIVGDIEDIGY